MIKVYKYGKLHRIYFPEWYADIAMLTLAAFLIILAA
jgi:hypothetical protein